MRSQPGQRGQRSTPAAAALRDPVVPLDFAGWFKRVRDGFRREFTGLAGLALIPTSLTSLYWIVLDAVRPAPAEIRQQLAAAASMSATGTVDPWTELKIEAPPVLPTMVIFALLITVGAAFAYGGAYHLALRRANGQPLGPVAALRAATPRVLPFLGWALLTWLVTTGLALLLLLPGIVTGSPWLQMIGPVLAVVLLIWVGVNVFAGILGVAFVERAGLARCFQLVKGRFWFAFGRTAVTMLGYLVYLAVTTVVIRLVLWPFGGAQALGHPALALVHLVNGALAVPSVVFLVVANLVTYAELRARADPSTTTRTLAAELNR